MAIIWLIQVLKKLNGWRSASARFATFPPCVRERRRCHDAERKLQTVNGRGDGLELIKWAEIIRSHLKTRRLCSSGGFILYICTVWYKLWGIWLEFYSVVVVLTTGGMKAHGSDVGVFARIRPTANFAQDLIECLPDGQVTNTSLPPAIIKIQ